MENRAWRAGVLAAAGLFIGEVGGALMHFPPFLPQRVLQNPIAAGALVLLVVGTVTSLWVWARTSRDSGRLTLAATITCTGGIAVIANVVAPAVGWWGGQALEGPLLPLAVLTGLRAMFLLSLVLLLYRWLAVRRQWLALLVYFLILLALIPATILADPVFLRSGVLTFGAGYTVWRDVAAGETGFALPLILYEFFRRYWRRPEGG